jgi:hypothetical protein
MKAYRVFYAEAPTYRRSYWIEVFATDKRNAKLLVKKMKAKRKKIQFLAVIEL